MMTNKVFSRALAVINTVLASGALAMSLLLSASAASAANVIFGDPSEPNKATEIQDLNVSGTLYDVTFNVDAIAAEIYGTFPGAFPIFNNADAARDAVLAVNAALQNEQALTVGEDAGEGSPIYNIGYDSYILPVGDIETVKVWRGLEETGEWLDALDNDWSYNLDAKTYAEFTFAGGGPDQFTLTVNKAGDGSGTVVSVPSGINCGDACSTDFDDGTSVTLTATQDAGSEFTSWSGCDQMQANTCTVAMTAAKAVTASFAKGGASTSRGINAGIIGIVLEE